MFQNSENEGRKGWARSLRYSWLAVGVVFFYVAGTIGLRWRENREIDLENQRKADAKRAEQDRRTVEGMGGDRFEILAFYSTPPDIRRGERSQLCYGVSNASAVSITPDVEPVRPSYARCVDVSPRKTTTYTLTATDAAGHTQTSTVAVRVR